MPDNPLPCLTSTALRKNEHYLKSWWRNVLGGNVFLMSRWERMFAAADGSWATQTQDWRAHTHTRTRTCLLMSRAGLSVTLNCNWHTVGAPNYIQPSQGEWKLFLTAQWIVQRVSTHADSPQKTTGGEEQMCLCSCQTTKSGTLEPVNRFTSKWRSLCQYITALKTKRRNKLGLHDESKYNQNHNMA